VQVDQIKQSDLTSDTLFKARLDYVMRSFINTQELIRFMDQKAGYLLTAVGLLTTALGIVAAKALDANAILIWQVDLASPALATFFKVLVLLSFLAYMVLAFVTLFHATRVFKALPNMRNRGSSAPGLIFPLILLERYRKGNAADEDSYYTQLLNVQGNDILHDFANQVMEISEIYQRKQRQINQSIRWFEYLSIAWIITVILFVVVTIVH
jgi:succinate dehydrogenase/fumarate reductase cytochrome b subunit